MLWGGLFFFIVMMALFMAVWLRPGFGRGIRPKHWIWWGGVIVPLPVILALTAASVWLGAAPPAPTLRIEAEARMWHWQFRYPDGTESTDVLHIPAGQDVLIAVTSPDVIHSFWIPRLGGKIDAVPGHENTIVLRADTPGEYGGICAEYCGTGHVDMSFTAIAHPEAE